MYIRTLYLACFGYRRATSNGQTFSLRVGFHLEPPGVLQHNRRPPSGSVLPVGRRARTFDRPARRLEAVLEWPRP